MTDAQSYENWMNERSERDMGDAAYADNEWLAFARSVESSDEVPQSFRAWAKELLGCGASEEQLKADYPHSRCGRSTRQSSTRVTIAPRGMSFDATGRLQQGEHGTKTPPVKADTEALRKHRGEAPTVDGMFTGESVAEAARSWQGWCDHRSMTGLAAFLGKVATLVDHAEDYCPPNS